MANNQVLKNDIASVIKTNGNNEITGALLQSVLFSIVNQLSIGGIYKGLATPATVPGIQDVNVFYLATQVGVYPNFNGLEVKKGEIVIVSNITGAWVKDVLINFNTIEKIEKTNTVGNVDTYTIFLSNGVNADFTVTNADMTDVNAAIDLMEDFIQNFAVVVDDFFNENSNNAISNKEVSKLAKVLNNFIQPTAINETDIININYSTEKKGAIKNDFTIEVLQVCTYFTFNTEGRQFLKFNGALLRADVPEQYWAIIGKKQNGETVGIKRPIVQYVNSENIIDVSEVTEVTVCIQNSGAGTILPTLKLYNDNGLLPSIKNDAVKEYIDNENEVLKNILDFFIIGQTSSNELIPNLQDDYIVNKVIEAPGNLIDNSNCDYIGVETKGRNRMYYKGVGAQTSPWDVRRWGTITGEKANGERTIIRYGEGSTNVIEEIYDITGYVKILITLTHGLGWPVVRLFDGVNIGGSFDAVKKYIDNKASNLPVGSDTYLFFDRPNYVPVINLIGDLPPDLTTSVNMTLEFRQGNNIVFKAPVTNKVQGSSTIYHPKKNWNIKFFNDNGGGLKLKFGNWFADGSFNLKANFNDRTLTRDISANKINALLLNDRPYPANIQRSTFNFYSQVDTFKNNLMDDGNFFLDGFPIELRVNNAFYGMYIWRQRRENENYRIDSAIKKNIYLANSNLDAIRLGNGFNAAQWELKSPKLKGYAENGTIPDANVLADINRLFDWFFGIKNNSINFNDTVNSYLVVDNLIDVIIGCQLSQNWDYYSNNLNLVTNDGLIWRFFVHDCDWSMGILNVAGQDVSSETGVKKLYWSGYYLNDYFWRDYIYPKILTQLKTRYTDLRNRNIITLDSIYKIIKEIPSKIGEKRYKDDMTAWALDGMNNDKGVYSTAFLMQFFKWKLEYLDSIWKL